MQKNVIVIGSGIIGASIAFHLARAGCAVTVVEADTSGGLATRNSFAWINASWGNPEFYVRFRMRSIAEWRRLDREVPGLGVVFGGGLIWDLPPAELEAFAREHESWGYGIRRVDRDGALLIEPGLKRPPQFALHVAEEGMVEPAIAARAMLAAASVRVTKASATALAMTAGRVTGVVTDMGLLPADEIVLAAGVGTPRLLETAGLSLAMDDPAGLIAHSTIANSKLLNGLVLSPDLHVRQTAEGRLIVGSDFAGADPDNRDREMAEDLMAQARDFVRGAEELTLEFFTVGYRPTPADGFPVIGRPRETPGVYVATMHSGITLAPVVGLLAAREITESDRDALLAPYHPDRTPIAIAGA